MLQIIQISVLTGATEECSSAGGCLKAETENASLAFERRGRRTVRDLVLAWTVTPVIAAFLAGVSYLLTAQLV